MKLSEYAKEKGVTYQTAYNWFKAGSIDNAIQMPTGTIVINEDKPLVSKRNKTVIYARVSSSEQRKTNLETQAQRMSEFSVKNGWQVDQVVKEVGSGLNDKRQKLIRVLTDPEVKRIVIEHRDRLTRFGFNYLETLAKLQGFEIVVANQTLDNDKNDLLADFTAIITSFCARLYSKRRTKHKVDQIKKDLKED